MAMRSFTRVVRFLFDGILFLLHKNHGKELIKMIGDVDIKVSQGSVGLKIPL